MSVPAHRRLEIECQHDGGALVRGRGSPRSRAALHCPRRRGASADARAGDAVAPPAPKGPRTEPHTRDSEVDRAIAALVEAGHWERVRAAALWQPPQYLSEDEQLAVVLEELADPDHPHHDAIGCIAVVLGDERVLRARDAAVR